jgi:hypothetical protein
MRATMCRAIYSSSSRQVAEEGSTYSSRHDPPPSNPPLLQISVALLRVSCEIVVCRGTPKRLIMAPSTRPMPPSDCTSRPSYSSPSSMAPERSYWRRWLGSIRVWYACQERERGIDRGDFSKYNIYIRMYICFDR